MLNVLLLAQNTAAMKKRGRELLLERLISARGFAWLPLPRPNLSTLILYPSLIDPIGISQTHRMCILGTLKRRCSVLNCAE